MCKLTDWSVVITAHGFQSYFSPVWRLFIWAVFENNRISRTFWATFSTVKIVHGF
jgi:hypothetical protein